MSSATATMPKKAHKRRVTHVRITKAANGFTVHREMEPDKTRKPGGIMVSDYDSMNPKPNVFTDKQAMLDHVGDLADQMGGDESGAPEPTQAA